MINKEQPANQRLPKLIKICLESMMNETSDTNLTLQAVDKILNGLKEAEADNKDKDIS